MGEFNIRVPIDAATVAALKTDDDFRRAAERLLPTFLDQYGRAAGETAWDELQKTFKGLSGGGGAITFKPNTSPSDRRQFIENAARNVKDNASAQDRQRFTAIIIQQLRDMKERSAASSAEGPSAG
jgi:hypothetical protein